MRGRPRLGSAKQGSVEKHIFPDLELFGQGYGNWSKANEAGIATIVFDGRGAPNPTNQSDSGDVLQPL